MGKVMDVQCPSCNAPLKYNAKLKAFKCEYCDNVFKAEDLKIKPIEEDKPSSEYVKYHCADCGAEVICDELTSATFCVYCGNTSIIKERLAGKFAPSKIIPFKKDKDEAITAFSNLGKHRPLMPKSFNSKENIEKITGVYIPFWLFSTKVSGVLNVKGTKFRVWTTGNRQYTETSLYEVIRGGDMEYNRIPVDGSTRFDNDIMNTIEPFNYKDLVDFNPAYLSGFLAEKYDVDDKSAYKDAMDRSLNSSKTILMNDMIGYSSKTVTSNTLASTLNECEYVLLPVWMVNVKYKDKYYIFAMNGQTGEFIGNIPISKGRTVAMFIILLFLLFGIFVLTLFIYFNLGGSL